jgi:hypothetical protein
MLGILALRYRPFIEQYRLPAFFPQMDSGTTAQDAELCEEETAYP